MKYLIMSMLLVSGCVASEPKCPDVEEAYRAGAEFALRTLKRKFDERGIVCGYPEEEKEKEAY